MAEDAWRTFRKQNSDFEDLTPQITSITRPDGSQLFRLNVGPFTDKEQVQEFCKKINIQSCDVVTLGG